MATKVRQEGDVAIVEVTGKMKVGERNPDTVWGTVLDLLDKGHTKIVLDLTDVSGMDSGGVGELIASHTSTANRGGKLKVAGLSPRVAEVLQSTLLLGVIDDYVTVAVAVASFESAS